MLSLKEHQPSVYMDCAELCAWRKGPHPLDPEIRLGYNAQGDGGPGRVETRKVWCPPARDSLVAGARWPGLMALVMVASTRYSNGQDHLEQRYSISSLAGATDADAKRFHGVMRTHGEIENRVHGVWDGAMAEDSHRTRKGESAQHLALMRKLALHL